MSTLELKGFKNKTTLPQFKSTNSIHPRNKRLHTPTKHHSFLHTPQPHSIDYDSTMSSKALVETNLPDIHSKRSSQKRSSFLQMWLDEALDPREKQTGESSPSLRVEVDKTGPLRTVQKFEIDKKYLKSQNMSVELIDKMYHSLYVYTYGINHTFEQILSLAKGSQHTDKKIMENFWNAFIRLLEGCTSFQTTFQIIEQGHIKSKNELKDSFRLREQQWLNEKASLETENIRLMKKINQQSLVISKLTADYNISQATLHLTDQAFNDEVNVRLMFEEKVNAIFSSYDELRTKYNRLLDDLRARETASTATDKRQHQLRRQLEQAHIRLNEANKQLQRERKDIETRDSELAVKRQEIFQLNGVRQQLLEEKEQNEEEVRKIVNKSAYYKSLSEEYKEEANCKSALLLELHSRVEKLDIQLKECRQLQQRLYSQLQQNSQEISSLKQNQIQLQLDLSQKQSLNQRITNQNLLIQETNRELLCKVSDLEKELLQTQGELAIKDSLVQKNTCLLASLQAVNAKLESLLTATKTQKARIEGELHTAVEVSERFKEEMTGMKMLLESKGIELEEVQSKLQNEREVFRSKIGGLKDEVEFKEQKVLEMHNQFVEGQEKVKVAEEQAKDLAWQNQQMRSQVLKIESELLQAKVRIESLENEIKKKGLAYRSLEDQLSSEQQHSKKYQQDLLSKQALLDTAGVHYQSEVHQLRDLLSAYRQDREKKVNHIHPMLYEDSLEQINRLTLAKEQLLRQLSYKNNQIDMFNREAQLKEQARQELERKAQAAQQLALHNEEKLVLLKESQRQLESQIQSSASLSQQGDQKHQQQILVLKGQIDELRLTVEAQRQRLVQANHEASDKQSLIQLLERDKKEIQASISQSRSSLLQAQQEIATLKENIVKLQTQQQASCREPQKEETIHRPPMVQKEVQTEKKFNHSFKYEVAQYYSSCGVQANHEEIDQERGREERSPPRDREVKKVEANQFKRALKITYMRR